MPKQLISISNLNNNNKLQCNTRHFNLLLKTCKNYSEN